LGCNVLYPRVEDGNKKLNKFEIFAAQHHVDMKTGPSNDLMDERLKQLK
jgi:hypothetical protein